MDKKEYISVAGLKGKRDWTDSLIKQLLGNPDKLVDNPHYKCAGKMRLYDMERVLQIEETPEFKAAFAASRKRSDKAKEVAERVVAAKTNRLCDFIVYCSRQFNRKKLLVSDY